MLKIERREQAAEVTTTTKQGETPLEVTLCNKAQGTTISLEETVEATRVQEVTGDPMGQMGELHKDQGPQEEDK